MNKYNKEKKSMKRRGENKNYEPIYGSDIFNQLPSKNNNNSNDESKNYDLFYEKFKEQENLYPPNTYSFQSKDIDKENKFDPFKTTYNCSYRPRHINENNIVGINKDIGTGVAYNSRKQKINFLKSNIVIFI